MVDELLPVLRPQIAIVVIPKPVIPYRLHIIRDLRILARVFLNMALLGRLSPSGARTLAASDYCQAGRSPATDGLAVKHRSQANGQQ